MTRTPHWVLLYYVNDADGDTCFFDGGEIVRRVAPKRGRAVFFDGRIAHASSGPVETRFRVVINVNLRAGIDVSPFRQASAS